LNYREKYHDNRNTEQIIDREFAPQQNRNTLKVLQSLLNTFRKAIPEEFSVSVYARLFIFLWCLFGRIWLGIWFSKLNGYAVKAMINLDVNRLIATMGNL